jgi:hypothetical protein
MEEPRLGQVGYLFFPFGDKLYVVVGWELTGKSPGTWQPATLVYETQLGVWAWPAQSAGDATVSLPLRVAIARHTTKSMSEAIEWIEPSTNAVFTVLA